MDMRRALNKRVIIVIVVILAVLLVAGGILVWRAVSDTPESIVDPNAKSKKPEELQDITYDTASTYKDSGSYAKGTITVSGVALDGTSFESLEITDGVGEGEVYLDNVSVSGELLIRGGGENSIYLDMAADGTKKTLDEANPGCSIPTVRVEKQNTHLVLGSQNIGELVIYSTNCVEIYGHVDKITVLPAQPKDHEYVSGVFVAEGASVGAVELQEQTGLFGPEGTVGTVTATAEGLDVTVYPLPGTETVPEEDEEGDEETDGNDSDNRSSSTPTWSPSQSTGGGTTGGGTTGGDNSGGAAGGGDNLGGTTGGEDNSGGTTGGGDNPDGTTGDGGTTAPGQPEIDLGDGGATDPGTSDTPVTENNE